MRRIAVCVLPLIVFATACGTGGELAVKDSLTLYSGREEALVEPLIERFEDESGIDVEVRFGDTAALASTIIEEGDRSPADVFWAQDAGALGAVAAEGRFAELPDGLRDRVPDAFRSPDGHWVGTSGRARVLVHNTDAVEQGQLPSSVLDLTEPRWEGRIGWAPTNGSFQAFVTALRKLEGDDAAREWLEGMRANGTQAYDGNSAIVQAVAAGEIDAGLVNHYYLLELSEEDPDIAERAANHTFEEGDPGNLVNVAGVGVLESAEHPEAARRFVEFLLSRTGEEYFGEETVEYPLQRGAQADERLVPLDEIGAPDIDLSDLADLQGTIALMREAGVL